ncbi:MAG: glycosyltransferase family 2 protein [Chitinophagales bacterium]|nr:glycosyltransferase family 2 protein [Chitinophagales bacterium]
MKTSLELTTLLWLPIALALAFNAVYLLVFSFAGLFYKNLSRKSAIPPEKRILVVYPVYKEDAVIFHSVKQFMAQRYPAQLFDLYVIADSLQGDTMMALQGMGAKVCELPPSDKRNKAVAINYLLGRLTFSYDVCIIMDADNLVEPDFLSRIDACFQQGVRVLQTRRIAKSISNELSLLDTFSEIINNHIFRKGQRALGFSSSLIGSGMAFDFNLYKEAMQGMNVFSGFDKELELRLLENNIRMEYAEDVVVYDDKVDNHQVFINQRRRWIYAQLYFLKHYFGRAIVQLIVYHNTDYVNKVVQFALLPRVIGLGINLLFVAFSAILGLAYFVAASLIFVCTVLALLLPVRVRLWNTNSLRALFELPVAFGSMVLALLTSKRAAGKFLHTPHKS